MKKSILTAIMVLEIASFSAALIFGFLWYLSPEENFEPLTFILGGGTVIAEIARRALSSRKQAQVIDSGNSLEGLIREIPKLDVSRGLRQALAYAKSNDLTELARWLRLELNGYDPTNGMKPNEYVPEYRKISGEHINEFGQRIRISEEKLRFINVARLRNGASELEEMLNSEESMFQIIDEGVNDYLRENLKIEVRSFAFARTAIGGTLENVRSELIDKLVDQAKSSSSQ